MARRAEILGGNGAREKYSSMECENTKMDYYSNICLFIELIVLRFTACQKAMLLDFVSKNQIISDIRLGSSKGMCKLLITFVSYSHGFNMHWLYFKEE